MTYTIILTDGQEIGEELADKAITTVSE